LEGKIKLASPSTLIIGYGNVLHATFPAETGKAIALVKYLIQQHHEINLPKIVGAIAPQRFGELRSIERCYLLILCRGVEEGKLTGRNITLP
jgi:hypothetical protein